MKYLIAIIISISMSNSVIAQTNGKYASVNGLKMYYEIHGKGFPLVLIHGGGSTIGTSFGRILPLLAKHHQIIAVEMQAHGHTADIDRAYSFEQDADDIAELLKQLHIPKANIFGFSNGASTTLQLAIRHPHLVNKIIVASTMYKRSGAFAGFWEMMENATFDDMPQPYKDAFLKINPSQDALHAMFNRDNMRMRTFKDIPDSAIQSIQAPALILAGDKDVVTPEHAVEMYRQLPHAQLMILPGGHGEYMGELTTLKPGVTEYPAMRLIEQFLAEPVAK